MGENIGCRVGSFGMKKGYYLFVENCGSSGVANKIAMQMNEFSKHFDIQALQILNNQRGIIKRIYNLMPWASFERDYTSTLGEMENPDFVYIRRTYVDRDYLRFLSEIHKRWSDCKIIVEQPVYPYDRDMLRSPYTVLHYIKELLYRKHYKDNIDIFVTYSDDDEILGVPTIRTMNGVNVDSIIPVNPKEEYDPNVIKIVAVATLIAHHGYERIIKGVYDYYNNGGTRNIVIDIVGEGTEKKKYQKLVDKYNLKNHFVFHGAKYGEDLNELYNNADIGLNALGAYKEGVRKLCTIKAREYLAKGLPVILGCEDNAFTGEVEKYGIVFENNSSTISVEKICDYLDQLYGENGKISVSSKIRAVAYNTVDNSKTLLPVINYIEER